MIPFKVASSQHLIVILLLCITPLFEAVELQSQNVEKLPTSVNSNRYNETAPVVSFDGSRLFFTKVGAPNTDNTLLVDGVNVFATLSQSEFTNVLSNVYKQLGDKNISDPYNSAFNQDIWISNISEDGFSRAINPGYPLNSALPNSAFGYNSNLNKLYMLNHFYERGGMNHGISVSKLNKGGVFEFPKPLYIRNFYNLGNQASMTISTDEEVIIMSLKRNDSYGGEDLFVSFKIRENVWSGPKNMGPNINSEFNETTPFLSDDKKYLFFSSDRGNRKMDIYVSEREDLSFTKWSSPTKLKQPLNSNHHETHPYFNELTGYLYFVSDRDGTKDIFLKNISEELWGKDKVFVYGRIFDNDGGELSNAHIFVYKGDAQPGFELSYHRSITGYYRMPLEKNQDYTLMLVSGDNRQTEVEFNTSIVDAKITRGFFEIEKNLCFDCTTEIVSEATRIENIMLQDKSFTLDERSLNFVRSKAELMPGYENILREVYEVFRNNPNWKIMIIGHTDPVGPRDLLFQLSEQRAEKIRNLLVQMGINKDRFQTRGMGPDNPLNDNSSEELRRINRRVEFRLMSID